jgi:hypothetical protein
MPLTHDSLRDALATLGSILEDRGYSYEVVVIGGGALLLIGLITRSTKDLDVVALADGDKWSRASPLPKPLTQAVKDVADALDLADDWLNAGPTDLLDFGLPEGFASRTTVERFGSLTVRYASRIDQVAFKLSAAADHWPDRSKHLHDLRALSPSVEDLVAAARWCTTHDTSAGFRDVQFAPVLLIFGVTDVPRE